MAVNLTPLHDRVIVKRIEEKETVKGGIIIPDSAKEKPQEGEVIAVGAGRREKGELIPLDVKPGDRVLFGKYGGTEIKLEGEEYLILREEELRNGEADCYWRGVTPVDSARRECSCGRGKDHFGPEGPQCGDRKEVWRPHHHQGRRHGCEGNRTEQPAREYGRADGA